MTDHRATPCSSALPPHQRNTLQLAAYMLIGIGIAPTALAETTADTKEAKDAAVMSEIIVSGEKVKRSVFDTITASTVYTESDIEESNNKTILDLLLEVPNVTIGGYGGIPNIRGVDGNGGGRSSYIWVGATRPRTATIVDGVSQIWTGGNVMDTGIWDVQQVEVLRGPQSTAQGRSAMGGAIVIETKAPSFEKEAVARIGAEQSNGKNKYQAAGAITGPITDDLAFRLSGNVISGKHYINYIDNSSDLNYNTDPDDLDTRDFKAKLLWKPKSTRDLSLRLDFQHSAQEGPYIDSVIGGDNGDYDAPMVTGEDGSSSGVNHRIGDTTLNSYIANLGFMLHPSIQTTFIGSYSQFDSGYFHNQPNRSFKMDGWEQDTINLEARLNFLKGTGPLSGMLGLSAIRDDQDLYIYYVDSMGSYDSDLFKGDTETETLSLFGEAEYAVTKRLDLILGGRLERETQDRNAMWLGTVTGLDNESKDETNFLPKAGLRFAVTENHNLGLDIRRGYTPGGLGWDRNNRSSEAAQTAYKFEPEYVTAIELSSKSRHWGNRVALNVNAFYNDYKDYQAYAGSGVLFGDGSTGGGITNVDEATTYGLELETRAFISDRTELFANASFLNTEVNSYEANPEWEGNALPYAAKQTFGAGVVHWFTNAISASLNVKHVGEYYDDLDNSSGADEGTDKVGDYTLVNLDLAYDVDDFTFKFYINNLTDEYIITYNDGTTQNVLPPRTIGVTLDYRF